MGCDIHLYVEKRVGGKWASADTFFRDEDGWLSTYDNSGKLKNHAFYHGRNYSLFAILADVRNGFGFAGVDTGDALVPICQPKGLPENASEEVITMASYYGGDGRSHSWLTVREIQEYDWTQVAVKRGVVSPAEYARYLLVGEPRAWVGAAVGGAVRNVSNREMEAEILQGADRAISWVDFRRLAADQSQTEVYTQVSWEVPYYDCATVFLSQTLPRLWRLGGPDDVRIVFFFDN